MESFMSRFLSASSAITVLTIGVSLAGAYAMTGSLIGSVSVSDLRRLGGVTVDDLKAFELWRIPVSQLLHGKAPHMVFNALWLFLLGDLIERSVGALRLLALWLIAGGVATAVSPIGLESPWNVGTGASQAVFAFASCAVVLAARDAVNRKRVIALASAYMAAGLFLDVATAGYPKPGHLVGALLGALIGATFRERAQRM
jgi:membrane associated rhomboid family serine protease